jgi:hypothetical protein
MMVKSIKQPNHGRYKLKKKKIWYTLNDLDEKEGIEYEAEIYDFSDYSIYFYNKKGQLVLQKKEKQQLSIRV